MSKILALPVQNLFNVLIIDTDTQTLAQTEQLIKSPFINTITSPSLLDAKTKIARFNQKWHTWILDFNTDVPDSGLEFLDIHSNFPYRIILSGQRNMHLAFEASRRGVLQIFDKCTDQNLTEFKRCVYSSCVLGFLLRGCRTDYLEIFLILQKDVITTPQNWATMACLGLRRLESICSLHFGIPPRQVISLYYYLCCHLHVPINLSRYDIINDTHNFWKPHYKSKHH
ncbi:hypothetical protein JXO59_04660, partial [candidate division KSB1 bacterium]|nr:hypothetical protein [candidate division KSB1 bacterium]